MAEKAEKKDAVEAEAKAPKSTAAKASTAKKAPAKTASASSKKAAPKAAAAKADSAEKAPASKTAQSGTAKKAAPKDKAAPKADAPASRPGVLKVHHLRPVPGANTRKTRVGRGEGSKGKTAGRGTKGQKARYQVKAGFEGGQMPLHMRTPKLRGFKNPFRVEYQVVNLEKLAELYPKGGDVTIGDLVAKGAVRKNEKVKVLGTGDIDVKLTVAVDKVSGSAEQKIVAAGGSVK
ncbi:MAG: 50S ribosomal protein L15 [Microbacterium sp.]